METPWQTSEHRNAAPEEDHDINTYNHSDVIYPLPNQLSGYFRGVEVGDIFLLSKLPGGLTISHNGIIEVLSEGDLSATGLDIDEDHAEIIMNDVDNDEETSDHEFQPVDYDTESTAVDDDAETVYEITNEDAEELEQEIQNLSCAGLYVVESVKYNDMVSDSDNNASAGDSRNRIIDINVIKLEHVLFPNADHGQTYNYQIYGDRYRVSGIKNLLPEYTGTLRNRQISHPSRSLSLMSRAGQLDNITIILGPNGDDIRAHLFDGNCPAICYGGWLHEIDYLNRLCNGYVSSACRSDFIVCPVCIGMDLMEIQQSLRYLFEQLHMVPPADFFPYAANLVIRRRHLRYAMQEFDTEQWDPESSDADSMAAFLAESMDPNNVISQPSPLPASEKAIAALHRKSFQIHLSEGGHGPEICPICLEKFDPATVVIEMACRHVCCNAGCVQTWLEESGTCPVCRARVEEDQNDDNGQDWDDDAEGEYGTDYDGDDEKENVEPLLNHTTLNTRQ